MSLLITILLLSTTLSPMSPVVGSFTIKNATPGCGGTVLVTAKITNSTGNTLSEFSKQFHYTMQEVLKGSIVGRFKIPFNGTVPGRYYAVITVSYCGVKRSERIPFTLAGVTLEKYRMVISTDSVTFYLTFKNTDSNAHIVFSRADVKVGGKNVASIMREDSIPPNSTLEIPLAVNTSKLSGNIANISVEYIYYGKEYKVTSQIVPLSNSNTGNSRIPIDQRVILLIVLAFVVVVVLLRG